MSYFWKKGGPKIAKIQKMRSVFFFSPRGKKKPEKCAYGEVGRRSYVITSKKKTIPFRLDAVSGFAQKLEHHQTQLLKSLTNCPSVTSPAIVRLICATETSVCRHEILKLRYYWNTLYGSSDAHRHKIHKYRKDKFLENSRGLVQDVFNICIKYKSIHILHGLAPPGRLNCKLNPLHYIKNVVIFHNLRADQEEDRTRNCFSKIYLVNPFVLQKKYQIVEPFKQPNYFSSTNGRKCFLKALLHQLLT